MSWFQPAEKCTPVSVLCDHETDTLKQKIISSHSSPSSLNPKLRSSEPFSDGSLWEHTNKVLFIPAPGGKPGSQGTATRWISLEQLWQDFTAVCYLCGYTENMAVVDPYNRLCQILEGTTLGQLTEQPRIRKVILRRAKRFAELFKWTGNDGLHQTMWLTYTPLWPTSFSCDLGMSPGAITTHCSEPAEQHLLKP